MLKKIRKLISALLTVVLLVNLSSYYSTAIIAPEDSVATNNKISIELSKVIESSDKEDIISTMVWFEDINPEPINALAEKNIGVTQEEIQKMVKSIPEIDSSVFGLDGDAYTKAINNYRAKTKEQRFEILSVQNKLILERRKLKTVEYQKHNALQATNAHIAKTNIDFVSSFSPVVIANLTPAEIYNLSKNDNVSFIGYNNCNIVKDSLGSATSAVQSDYTRNTLGFDGYGVKIGMCESGGPKAHSELNSSQIIDLAQNNYKTDHATKVARIMIGSNGVAPNATLYTTNLMLGDEALNQIESMLIQGVNVINFSAGTTRDSGVYYTDLEKWFDHIISQHDVSVVVAAGNNGVYSDVISPGLGYNVITVGGTHTRLTSTRDDDILYNISTIEGSSSSNGGTAGCAKPDFLAPAVMWEDIIDNRGTSFAAPIVTGIIAQMIEYKPDIADRPELIKAILTASTDKKVAPGGNSAASEVWAGTITAQQGAGQVNAKRAISILGKGRYSYGTMSTGTSTKTFTVSSSDSWIRYSLAWSRSSSISGSYNGHSQNIPSVGVAPNLKLQIYNPSNTSMGISNIPTSSVELVHFTVGTTGTHTAKITRTDTGTNSVEYAVAWY